MVGVVCLLVFGLFRNRISIYKTRLVCSATITAPVLPHRSQCQYLIMSATSGYHLLLQFKPDGHA